MVRWFFDLQRFADVENNTSNTLVSGTNDSDTVSNYANNVTVYANGGNDKIVNRGSNVFIDGGIGNDAIDLDPYYHGSIKNVTLTGGTGNDTFVIDPYKSNTISAVITDFTADDVLVYDADFDDTKELSYTIEDDNMVIKNNLSSDGSKISPTFVVTLKGVSSLSQISSAKYYKVTNWNMNSLSGKNSESYTFSSLFNPLVSGTSYDDSIRNGGNYVTINTDAGNDSIFNTGDNATISGGADNDSISNNGSNVSISGDEGNDYILNDSVSNVIINAGAGDDYILNNSVSNVTINAGAGDDTINSQGNNVLLNYANGDGNDYVFGFGTNYTLQIGGGTGTYSSQTSGSNIIVTIGESKITLVGEASLSNFEIKGKEQLPLFISGNDTDDVINNSSKNVTISAFGGNDSITAKGNNSSIVAGTGKDIVNIYGNNSTVDGDANEDTIQNFGARNSIVGGAGNDTLMNKTSYTDYEISYVPETKIVEKPVYQNIEEAYTETTTEYEDIYDWVDEPYTYYETVYETVYRYGAGGTLIKSSVPKMVETIKYRRAYKKIGVQPVTKTETKYRTVQKQVGTEWVEETTQKEIRTPVERQTNNINSTLSGGAGDDYIVNEAANFIYSYTDGDGNDYVTGFNANSTLSIGGGTGTYSTTKSGSDLIVNVGTGKITLQGAASLSKVNIDGVEKNSWKISGNTATYDDLITISGIADSVTASNFYVSGKTITIGKAAVQTNGTAVKLLTDGYTLKLGKGMTASETLSAATYDAKTMTLNTKGTTAGYNLSSDGKSISYTAGTSKEFQFSGIASGATASNFYISGKTITIGKAAVKTNGTPVKLLTNGYTLKLGKDMMASETLSAATYDAKTMTLNTKGTTAGYNLSSDGKSISYTAGTSKEFQFSGIASGATASNFYISGKTITIGKAAVQTNGTAVKLLNQSGYTLKLGKGMTAPTDNAPTLKSGVYTFGGTSAGYVLDNTNKTITYSAATSATLKLSGVKSTPTAPSNGVVTLKLANFNNNLSVTSNAGKYKFSIASGTYTGKTFTGSSGADTIANAGSSLIINSGKGNDSIKSSGANSTINAGAGADTVAGSTGADTLNGDAGNDLIWGGKGNDSILGGSGNDSLNGAAGADILWGGTGNDTLIGGAGDDTFIYKPNEGTDHITDYTNGDILKILKTDGTNGTYTKAAFASNKLTLTISGGGSVIFDNVSAGSKININGTTKTISGNTLK